MGLKLKTNKYNIFFILCIIMIIIFIITSIIYKYTKQNVINNNKNIDKFDNTPIYSLPPNTILTNIESMSRFFRNNAEITLAENSTLDSESCSIYDYIPLEDPSAFIFSVRLMLLLPETSAIAGIAIMTCADDPTKYVKTFHITFMDTYDSDPISINDGDGNAIIFNSNLTGDSNQISYILFPNILINKHSISIIPITWNNQVDMQTASQLGIRCDLLSSVLPTTTLSLNPITTKSCFNFNDSNDSPFFMNEINKPRGQLDTSPETEIYQHNFEGTSNVYAPAIYYNMEEFSPVNLYDDKFAKY
jgi:hypothetical protein